MNIGSPNTYATNKPHSSGGFSGLASNMDTDAMVESMLAGTQAKIDKQNALRQQTIWKQDILRDIITQINSFQKKYFDIANNSSLRNASFYNIMKAASSSDAIKATIRSGAMEGRTTVEVKSLATNSQMKSKDPISGKISGEFDASAFEKKVTFEVGDDTVEVDLSGAKTNQEVQDALTAALGSKGVTVTVSEKGALSFESEKELRVTGKSTDLGLKTLGLSKGLKSGHDYTKDKEIMGGTVKTDIETKVNVTFNGVTKSIALSGTTNDEIKASFKEGLNVFGKDAITFNDLGGGKFELSAKVGQTVSISGDTAEMKALGIKSGTSTKLSGSMKLKDLNVNPKLQGDVFEFEINGKKITASGEDTVSGLLGKINSSGAGVTAIYNGMDDSFTMKRTDSGAGFDIEIKQTKGNILSVMFGAESGNSVVSKTLTTGSISGSGIPADFKTDGGPDTVFSFTVDGQDYKFKFPTRYEVDDKGNPKKDVKPYTGEEIKKDINQRLEALTGYTENGERAIELMDDGTFMVRNGAKVEFAKAADGDPKKNNLAQQFGFTSETAGKSNVATGENTLDELGLAGLEGLGGDVKLTDLDALTGGKVKFEDGRLTYTDTGDGMALSGGFMKQLFGSDTVNLGSSTGLNAADVVLGQNAIVVLDGVETERSSNNFSYNGIDFELKEAKVGEVITVDVTRDTTQIYDTLKGFVEDYNKLLDKLNTLVDDDPEYKKYAPLTDDHKKEMSENEIKLWEEKAKKGLLRRDSSITTLLTGLRGALYQKPAGSKYALYDIGIETGEWKEKGKLVIKDEAKLKNLITTDPDGIMNLFRGDGSLGGGLAGALNTIMDKAAKTEGTKGSLVEIAGYKGKGNEFTNQLTKKVTSIDAKIKNLKYNYDLQKSRYWKQFNAMESMISNMGSQSSWLAQQFG